MPMELSSQVVSVNLCVSLSTVNAVDVCRLTLDSRIVCVVIEG